MSLPFKDFFLSPEIRVVEASAGSGKTYALARRYVQLILHLRRARGNCPIHSILAITFTNKAAFEMKARILKFLKQLALGVMPPDEAASLLEPVGLTVAEAKGLAQEIMQGILRHYNYFQVETIDKFINTLLSSAAFEIGLTANFRIKTDSRPYLAQAVDVLISRLPFDAALARAFDDFLTSMLLVESRSSWLPKDVVVETMSRLFEVHNVYGYDFADPLMGPQDLIAVKSRVLSELQSFASPLPEGLQERFALGVKEFLEAHDHVFSFKRVPKSFDPANEKRLKKGMELPPFYADAWARVEEALMQAAELEVAHLYDPYIVIFNEVKKVLDEACVRDDVIFLSQLNFKARQVYALGLGVDELYYRLAARSEHYLLDEFQDTSKLQWDNLKVLPDEAISKGGSLFYVGDKKQAIYGFRGGDTRLFDAVANMYSAPDYHCRKDALDRNFRSRQAIVNFNNHVFSLKNLERLLGAHNDKGEALLPVRALDRDELHRIYKSAFQHSVLSGPTGYVRLQILKGTRKDDFREDARKEVLSRINELSSRFSFSEIVILVRKNDDVQELTRWLLEAGIPATSERTLNIKEHVLIKEVVAFIRFLTSLSDNASLGQFILGDIFHAASGIDRDALKDFMMSLRANHDKNLYQAFSHAYPLAAENFLKPFEQEIGLLPLYELLISFFKKTQVLDKFPHARGFLMRFLDVVKNHEDEFPDAVSFLGFLENMNTDELFVEMLDTQEATEAVKVMTIHKAKGLEFPVVILPFLTMGIGGVKEAGNKALAFTLRVEDEHLKLYHFSSAHLPYSKAAEALDIDDDMAVFFSELNNMYVALTRASCELYGFIPCRSGNAHNLALELFPPEVFEQGEPNADYPAGAGKDAKEPVSILPPLACRDWMSLIDAEFLPENLAKDGV